MTTLQQVNLRARHTDETRAALIASARLLFAEKGYHNVGIREFAAHAGVTRGAMYHHFKDKEDLFISVIESIQVELNERAISRRNQPIRPNRWKQLRQELQFALDDMMSPDIAQILLIDAPSVLGWEKWRVQKSRNGLNAIRKAVEISISDGLIKPLSAEELTNLISASFNEANLLIAYSKNPQETRKYAGLALDSMLIGLQLFEE